MKRESNMPEADFYFIIVSDSLRESCCRMDKFGDLEKVKKKKKKIYHRIKME